MKKTTETPAPKTRGQTKTPDKRDLELALLLAARMLLIGRPDLYKTYQPVTTTGEIVSRALIQAHSLNDPLPGSNT